MIHSRLVSTIVVVMLVFVAMLACTQQPIPTASVVPTATFVAPTVTFVSPLKTLSPLSTPSVVRPTIPPKTIIHRAFLPVVVKQFKSRPVSTSVIPTTTIPINLGGLHVEGTGDHSGYEEFLRACSAANRPVALIKVFGDGYSAKIAKEIDPRTVTIWRKPAKTGHDDYMDNPPGDWNWPATETAERVHTWLQAMYPDWEANRQYIDYFEIVNEPNMATVTQTLRATEFMLAAMQEAEQQNPPYHLAIWSFSSGTPEPWQADIISPTLRYAAEHGHILSVHDGSVDDERRLFRQAAKDGTALRYRMFEPMLGQFMPRVAVTEAYQPDGYETPDWFDWQWYLTELAKDKVIGAAWFTLGPYSFGGGQDVNIVAQLPDFALVLGCK
jgi:hypothetical protein